MRKESLIGQKFGYLEVFADAPSIKGKGASWCKCICGTEKIISNAALKKQAKSCGCKTRDIISESKRKDLTLEKFGTLKPVKIIGHRGEKILWECLCDCGRIKEVTSGDLVGGHVKSCGYCQRSTLERDLTGQRFGKLVVLNKEANIGVKTAWKVKCDCGKENITKTGNLVNGHARSCGCEINYIKMNPLGKTFGRLTVISDFDRQGSSRYYLCKCSCGEETVVSTTCLNSGTTRSCGCLRRELTAKRMSLLKGEKNYGWKGGNAISERGTSEYSKWRKFVLKRDSCICQICGETENIEAHHLNSFLKFKDQRFLPENGVCLCHFCHKLFHVEYGSGDNTKEQFEEFRAKLGV